MTHVLTGLDLFDSMSAGPMNHLITTIRCLNGPHEGLNNVLDEASDSECVFGEKYVKTQGLDEEGHACYTHEGPWLWKSGRTPKPKIQRRKGQKQWDREEK